MKFLNQLRDWLETHWIFPAASGWLMGGLALFFFAAATNTMAGWLYVISGVMVAILALGSVLPWYTLRGLKLQQLPIAPVTAGDPLPIELVVENLTPQTKTLVQLQTRLPAPLPTIRTVIEQIPAHHQEAWMAIVPTMQRGIYRWQSVELRTAAPLGLVWCRRSQPVQARAIVYPQVLSLAQCPIVDEMGQQDHLHLSSLYRSKLATEGLSRGLRPYRWGDATRFIHWRSSARYGELRVRELETYLGGQELIVALDGAGWPVDWFEQAVIAAASLYFYALRRQMRVSLWTAATDQIQGEQRILETLAGIQPQTTSVTINRPQSAILWLTSSIPSLADLPTGSRWLLWSSPTEPIDQPIASIGLQLFADRSLPLQLQQPPTQVPATSPQPGAPLHD
ncbi:MAG: DUF58 domain-containing protein [Elainella sp. Prado103]|jgi:uncharacterized protein (DUF58 family)|nr:DUF58 domain-containing protein [Elainella sp. Prado103]